MQDVPSPNLIDDLIEQLLNEPEDVWPAALERLCVDNPESAVALQRRVAVLERAASDLDIREASKSGSVAQY